MKSNILVFSGRNIKGNTLSIALYLSSIIENKSSIIEIKNLDINPCGNCNYECFSNSSCIHNDSMDELFNEIVRSETLYYLIPIYNGFAPSHFMKYIERLQGFMKHANYNVFTKLLKKCIIVGNRNSGASFLEQWLIEEMQIEKKNVLILESTEFKISSIRGQIIEIEEVQRRISKFLD